MGVKWSPATERGVLDFSGKMLRLSHPIANSFPQCPLSRDNYIFSVKVITKIPPGATESKTLRDKHKVRQGLIPSFDISDSSDKG
jgi:hypothetical protein